jgi:hypothetical protein
MAIVSKRAQSAPGEETPCDDSAAPVARREWIGLGAVLVAAAALRLYGLDRDSLWLDETIQYAGSSCSLGSLYQTLFPQEMFLSFLFGRGFVWLGWDDSTWILRLPIVALGVATVGATWMSARELFGARAALPASVVACACPALVFYSQEYRMYSLLALLTASASWALARALRTGAEWSWTTFAALCLLSLYTHFVAFASAVSYAVVTAIVLARSAWTKAGAETGETSREHATGRTTLHGAIRAGAFVAIGLLPVVPLLFRFVTHERQPSADGETASAATALRAMLAAFGCTNGCLRDWAFLVVACVGLAGGWKRRRHTGVFCAAGTLLVPALALAAAGSDRMAMSGRYTVFLLPMYCAAIGAGWMVIADGVAGLTARFVGRAPALSRAALATAAIGVSLAPMLARVYAVNLKSVPADLDSAYRFVCANLESDDLLVETGTRGGTPGAWFRHYDSYYFRRTGPVPAPRRIRLERDRPCPRPDDAVGTGRLWAMVSADESEVAAITAATAAAFEVHRFRGMVVLRIRREIAGPMPDEFRLLLDTLQPWLESSPQAGT